MSQNKQLSLIINPIAGERNNLKLAEKIAHRLEKSGWEVRQLPTKYAGHARSLIEEEVNRGSRLIASMGGDGTINEVASSLVNTDITMGIIPCGSGNGLARMIGLSGNTSRVLHYFEKGEMSAIDVGVMDEHYFFCTCGFGFDAMVAHSFSGSKERGLKTYIESTIQKAIEFKGVYAEFLLDGKAFSGEFMLVAIANANQYGNNAFIAPDAQLDDGWLDVTVIRKFPKILAGAVATALFAKQIDQFRFVETYRVKEVEITQLSQLLFHRDGDHFRVELPVQIKIMPKALKLLRPAMSKLKEAELKLRHMEFYDLIRQKIKL